MSDLVAIAAGLDSWEAHLLRGRLQSEGIFATVSDEDGNRYVGGAVRVMVRVGSANTRRRFPLEMWSIQFRERNSTRKPSRLFAPNHVFLNSSPSGAFRFQNTAPPSYAPL